MDKIGFSKVALICMLLFLAAFIAVCLFIIYRTGNEPSTLITCVFAFCGVEGGLMAWIKTVKVKSKRKEEDSKC
jgi:hypothetical protein